MRRKLWKSNTPVCFHVLSMSCNSIFHSSSCFSYLLNIKGQSLTSGPWQADLDLLRAVFIYVNTTNEIWCACSPLPQLQEISCHSSLLVALLSANLVGSCLDGSAFLSYEISELSFPFRFYLCTYSCHETSPWAAAAWVLSPPFICSREYRLSRMREILEACEMEVTVATSERMEGEKKTTKENTLSPFFLHRSSPALSVCNP